MANGAALPGERGTGLRPLLRSDLERVAALERELFGVGAWSRRTLEDEVRARDRTYIAAIEGGELVGYAGISLGEDAEVMTVGVAAPWRRRGVGAALLDGLLAAARAARCRRVFLEVRTDSDGARRLYERAGFRPVGIRRGYYQPENVDALVMRLDLRGVGPMTSAAVGPALPGSGPHPGKETM